jgi:hypothetical protein
VQSSATNICSGRLHNDLELRTHKKWTQILRPSVISLMPVSSVACIVCDYTVLCACINAGHFH